MGLILPVVMLLVVVDRETLAARVRIFVAENILIYYFEQQRLLLENQFLQNICEIYMKDTLRYIISLDSVIA